MLDKATASITHLLPTSLDLADLPSPGNAILSDLALITVNPPTATGSPACLSIVFRGTHASLADIHHAYPDGLYSRPALSSQRFDLATRNRVPQSVNDRRRTRPSEVWDHLFNADSARSEDTEHGPKGSGFDDLTELDRAVVTLSSGLTSHAPDMAKELDWADFQNAWNDFWPYLSDQHSPVRKRLALPSPDDFVAHTASDVAETTSRSLRWPVLSGRDPSVLSAAGPSTIDLLLYHVASRLIAGTHSQSARGLNIMLVRDALSEDMLEFWSPLGDEQAGRVGSQPATASGQTPHMLVGWMERSGFSQSAPSSSTLTIGSQRSNGEATGYVVYSIHLEDDSIVIHDQFLQEPSTQDEERWKTVSARLHSEHY